MASFISRSVLAIFSWINLRDASGEVFLEGGGGGRLIVCGAEGVVIEAFPELLSLNYFLKKPTNQKEYKSQTGFY